jgi:hypothetical protein
MSASTYVAQQTDGVPARAAARLTDLGADVDLTALPDRELSESELLDLVASVAARPELWSDDVQFAGQSRHYRCLHRDAHVDVWLLCWTPNDDTGWHDHDISSGAVAVVQGCLVERNLAVGVASFDTDVPAGRVFSFGPDHIHRLTGRDDASVSVHAYSPPLWRMGQYAVGANGVLRRVSLSYADELRPLGPEPVA